MMPHYTPLVPTTLGEIVDLLGWIMLKSPLFEDPELPGVNAEVTFYELTAGLTEVRDKLGEEKYESLSQLAERTRELFQSDPFDTTGGAHAGRLLVRQMLEVIRS